MVTILNENEFHSSFNLKSKFAIYLHTYGTDCVYDMSYDVAIKHSYKSVRKC